MKDILVVCLFILPLALARSEVGLGDGNPLLPKKSDCKVGVYEAAISCAINKGGNGTLSSELHCLKPILKEYLDCAHLDVLSFVQSSEGNDLLKSTNLSPSQVRCILDNILEFARCNVDGLIIDDKPWRWSWLAFARCVVTSIPKYFICLNIATPIT